MTVTKMNYTDDEIITCLSKSDKQTDDAIRFLYRIYYGYLSSYVLNNNGSSDDAQDIFQDVVISFISLIKAGKFRGEASIKTFLYTMNRNLWLNELKRRGRAQAREDKYENLQAKPQIQVDKAIEYRESKNQLMQLMDQIGETCKKILLQYYYENQSMKEIVATLHYENEQVVRNKKSQCLKKMAELVQNNPSVYQQFKTFWHE